MESTLSLKVDLHSTAVILSSALLMSINWWWCVASVVSVVSVVVIVVSVVSVVFIVASVVRVVGVVMSVVSVVVIVMSAYYNLQSLKTALQDPVNPSLLQNYSTSQSKEHISIIVEGPIFSPIFFLPTVDLNPSKMAFFGQKFDLKCCASIIFWGKKIVPPFFFFKYFWSPDFLFWQVLPLPLKARFLLWLSTVRY